MAAFFLGSLHSGLQVADIVQCIEDTDDIDTVCDGLLYEVFYYIIRIVTIAQNVLAAEQHLHLGILETIAHLAETLPRIFLQETKSRIESSAAPHLNCVVTNLIHLVDDRKHLLRGHTSCDQGLLTVTKNGLSNFNWFNSFCHFILVLLIIHRRLP